ncbi:MAG: lysozyme [Bacteroidales bacterium]|nr:lysozyme [Bacteroidales bacterium]
MSINLKFILFTNLILILNFSGILLNNKSPEGGEDKKAKRVQETDNEKIRVRPLFDFDKQYERTIDFIKQHEGFANGKAYVCPGGHKTIGYGHIVLNTDNFSSITKKQADSLLRADFDKAIKALEADNMVNLEGSKKLAIAHFIFAKGIGSYYNSTLREKIINNQKIDDEILRWVYYTNRKGEKIQSSHALKIRKWELAMYKKRHT